MPFDLHLSVTKEREEFEGTRDAWMGVKYRLPAAYLRQRHTQRPNGYFFFEW